jgi:hypothetical protein
MKKVFTRTVSAEESVEGYIMVPKNELRYFPPGKKRFLLVDEGKRRKVKVESYQCECRGPEKPHKHYFLRKPGLQRGNSVEICKDGEAKFSLKIK